MTEPAERDSSPRAEAIRRRLADAWGEMGAAWGVAPAVARVHAYLLASQRPLTEREVREALGLSHRAATLAIGEAVAWGLVEPTPEPRRVGRRGPAGVGYSAIGDHWRWFGRIVEERKRREGDPIVAALVSAENEAAAEAAANPEDRELAELAGWLESFLAFVRLFDRAIDLVPRLEPAALERLLGVVGRLPDRTIEQLARVAVSIPEDDLADLAEAVAKVPPGRAAGVAGLMAAVAKTAGRARSIAR